MERSLVKHGESTLMVSIPAAWARRHHLEKGDAVDMLDEGECLVLVRKGKKKAEEAACELARQCQCGVFNPQRALHLIEQLSKKDHLA